MRRIEFHLKARTELLESAKFYESQQVGLGKRFAAAVHDNVRHIEMHPQLYRVLEGEIRQSKVSRFPYGIIYRLKPERIEIIAVMHLYREPGYWKSRITSD